MKELLPTKETPVIYDKNCVFYTEKLVMDGNTYLYDNITFIFYEQSVDKINGYKLTDEIYFKWFEIPEKIDFLNIDGNYPIDGMIDFEFKKGILPTFKKNSKQLKSLYKYISNFTFERRLNLYLNTFKKYSKINIFGFMIHNNGDIYDEGEYQGNIVEKYHKNELEWGDSYGSYKHKISDPFHFGFQKGTKFFGIFKDNFEIRNNCNKDVFDKLIGRMISNGSVI